MAGRKVEFSTRKQAKVHGSGTLGYNQWKARAGDIITYKERYEDGTHGYRQARVVGVITSHDHIEGEKPNQYAGNLLVLAFSDDLTFGYERWVKPEDVTDCKRPEHAATFLAFALDADPERLFKYIRDDLETRQAASYRPE